MLRPALIAEAMRNALLGSTVILRTPPPSVQIAALDGDAATLDLALRVADFARIGAARSELLDLVFIYAKAADLRLTSQRSTASVEPQPELPARPSPLRLVEAMPSSQPWRVRSVNTCPGS